MGMKKEGLTALVAGIIKTKTYHRASLWKTALAEAVNVHALSKVWPMQLDAGVKVAEMRINLKPTRKQ